MRTASRNLVSILDFEPSQIQEVLDTAESMQEVGERDIKKVPVLRGRIIANLFYENSTRTRVSFEIAAKRLSADVINIDAATSSVAKGESLLDTALTLLAMGTDCIVLRHPSPGAPARLAVSIDASVINAGDGAHEHPTQALCDMFVLRKRFGSLDGLHVGFVGDIAHSRVARSSALGLEAMGAKITFVGPPTMVPNQDSRVVYDFDAALPGLDVVYMLRLQAERHKEGLIPSESEFVGLYSLTPPRLECLGANTAIMHAGPMMRGVEISSEAAEDKRSLIRDQVTAGVAVRAALLYTLVGSK